MRPLGLAIEPSTTGVQHWPVQISTAQKAGRNVLVKEIGGAVMGLWSKYLVSKEVAGVALFIDASNRAGVSAAVTELYAVLRHPDAQVCILLRDARCSS